MMCVCVCVCVCVCWMVLQVQELVARYCTSLWEFNLRDILRWSELVTTSAKVISLTVQVSLSLHALG